MWYSDEKQEGKMMVILVLTEGNLTGLSAQGESCCMAFMCSNKGNHSLRNPPKKKKKKTVKRNVTLLMSNYFLYEEQAPKERERRFCVIRKLAD